jgi:hypothetical protein
LTHANLGLLKAEDMQQALNWPSPRPSRVSFAAVDSLGCWVARLEAASKDDTWGSSCITRSSAFKLSGPLRRARSMTATRIESWIASTTRAVSSPNGLQIKLLRRAGKAKASCWKADAMTTWLLL